MIIARAVVILMSAAASLSSVAAQTLAKITQVSVTTSNTDGGVRMHNSEMEARGKSLRRLVSAAYMTAERRVVDGPGWMNEDGFDFLLKTEPASAEDFRATVRQVLGEHFGLVAHKESRSMPVYVLKPAQGKQTKMRQAATERSRVSSDDGLIEARETPMWLLANHLERYADRLVVDETGLKGGWNFKLNWGGGGMKAMHSAIGIQLGLELVEETRPVEVVVIDKVDRLRSK